MKIKFEAKYNNIIVGENKIYEIDVESWELEGMTKEEKEKYIKKSIYNYIELYILKDILKNININIKK